MSDSQSTDVREEELINATVGLQPEDSDTAEPATLSDSGLPESTPDVQIEVQQAALEGDGDTQANAEGLEAEPSEDLHQGEQGQAEGTLNPQDASSVQQDTPLNVSQQNDAEDGAAEEMSASAGPAVETDQDAYISGSTAVQASSAADDSSSVSADAELFSSAAGRQASAEEQQVSGTLAAALANPELDPDHPLLARAQKALGKQLLAIKERLEAEVREKAVALQVCTSLCTLSASVLQAA